MKMIISPAKKMNVDTDTYETGGLPEFIEDARILMNTVKALSFAKAKALWKCNEKLARLNYERFQTMDLERALTPAVIAYEGLQYQHMAPGVFTKEELSYIGEHLYILSGFYGLLKPFDGVVPYRLEMQAGLSVNGGKDLYSFWGDRLYKRLSGDDHIIINLASKEYAKCIEKYLTPKDRFLTVEFGVLTEGKVRQKGTLAKMARGEMVRFMAQNRIGNPEGMKAFKELGFSFSRELSSEDRYVYVTADAGQRQTSLW
ncbi:hypothetical protein IMSAGC009_03632 [Lachnospiraceae bacterium]|nr:hypothetical protein IMSAGC009_03632 [Lachnospiraceae bacterium]